MKITLNDCLNLPVFDDAMVLTPDLNRDKEVRKISFLDACNADDVLKVCGEEHQIVLTDFSFLKDSIKEQCAVVRHIAKVNTTALVIFNVGRVLKGIAPLLVRTCNRADIVLVVLQDSSDRNMTQVAEELYGTLFYGNGEQFGNTLITNSIFHLLNFEKYLDFQSAVRAAAINNNFQIVLLSSDFNPVLTVETRFKTTIDRAIRLGRRADMENQFHVYTMIDVDGVLTYWGPVAIGEATYYMFIVDNEDSYSAAEITKLAEIIELAMGMWKFTPYRDVQAELVRALRRGNSNLAYAVMEEAELKDYPFVSLFLASDLNLDKANKIIGDFCSEKNIKYIQIQEERYTYGVILGDVDKLKCIDLYNELKETKGVKICHITGLTDIESACDAFRLINETREFTDIVYPHKRVFSQYELSLIDSCINIQLQCGFLRRSYSRMLESLEVRGGSKGAQLLLTLECFVLDAGFNATISANILGIHVNTVQYRLKSISKLSSSEIMGNRVVPGLTLALILKRLERGNDESRHMLSCRA